MTTLPQLHPQAVARSPSTTTSSGTAAGTASSRNPFARPKLAALPGASSGSFRRSTLLPSVAPASAASTSPALSNNAPTEVGGRGGVPATPSGKDIPAQSAMSSVGSVGKARSGWRLLWRGGLEIGREGWRLDGITFFALISFPTPNTPNANPSNPFDVPIQPQPFPTPRSSSTTSAAEAGGGAGHSGSPFPTFPSADTDLCLSLESMRGRKYLQVRGLTPLSEDEVLDGAPSAQGEEGGVQMAISEQSPLLAAYFTGLLCREPKLSALGRTLNAIIIGLGDEGIDSTSSSILVYGQRRDTNSATGEGTGTLRLCVARRKAPAVASAKKVRPGEPLPRAPLFFPAKAPKKPLPLFPSRSLSRATSISSIYHPPSATVPAAPVSLPSTSSASSSSGPSHSAAAAPLSGRTPGRRGEKRPRKLDISDEERKRKAGKIVLDRNSQEEGSRSNSTTAVPEQTAEEDIFGRRGASVPRPPAIYQPTRNAGQDAVAESEELLDGLANGVRPPRLDAAAEVAEPASNLMGRTKRRVPQQILDNKSAIRKQTLVLLESRGIARTHEAFKDVFGMASKGTYFAFRDQLESGQLSKIDIHRVINTHLNMYLPQNPLEAGGKEDVDDDEEVDADEHESSVKIEQVSVKEGYEEVKLEGTFLHSHQYMLQRREERKGVLGVVDEEDEGGKEE